MVWEQTVPPTRLSEHPAKRSTVFGCMGRRNAWQSLCRTCEAPTLVRILDPHPSRVRVISAAPRLTLSNNLQSLSLEARKDWLDKGTACRRHENKSRRVAHSPQ